jgi:hypothetical protein
MKKLIALATAAFVVGVLALPAQAAKPVPTGTITGPNEVVPYALGSTVTFTTTTTALAGWEYPMVAVWCYQDAVLVYMQLDYPDVGFVLGGGSSDWLVSGGPASCTANLYAYGNKAHVQTIKPLASTNFDAAG